MAGFELGLVVFDKACQCLVCGEDEKRGKKGGRSVSRA